MLQCLERGTVCRSVGSTSMNAVSSRSHAIFTVTIEQMVEEVEIACTVDADGAGGAPEHSAGASCCSAITSKFHFVDLAGSERAKRTQVRACPTLVPCVPALESDEPALAGGWRPAEGGHQHQLRAPGPRQRDQRAGRREPQGEPRAVPRLQAHAHAAGSRRAARGAEGPPSADCAGVRRTRSGGTAARS
jgi:hypothetical protein